MHRYSKYVLMECMYDSDKLTLTAINTIVTDHEQ